MTPTRRTLAAATTRSRLFDLGGRSESVLALVSTGVRAKGGSEGAVGSDVGVVALAPGDIAPLLEQQDLAQVVERREPGVDEVAELPFALLVESPVLGLLLFLRGQRVHSRPR